jgi:ASC-1-like (ASCH) protein
MPLFMVKREAFDSCRLGERDVELRTVKRQWKNSKAGDIATIQCGRDIFRKKIMKIHRGTLARIFMKVDYKRIFPDASTVFEAVKAAKELYPKEQEFMAFELEDIF